MSFCQILSLDALDFLHTFLKSFPGLRTTKYICIFRKQPLSLSERHAGTLVILTGRDKRSYNLTLWIGLCGPWLHFFIALVGRNKVRLTSIQMQVWDDLCSCPCLSTLVAISRKWCQTEVSRSPSQKDPGVAHCCTGTFSLYLQHEATYH